MKWLEYIWFSFPLRLLLTHLKSYFLLLGSWVLILLVITQNFATDFGVPYLFLDPEYGGVVGYFSFQLVGVCFGIFFITWNMSTYLLHSYKFPFVASLRWPFAMFTLNNALVPIIFFGIYVQQIIRFQRVEALKEPIQIFWSITGLLAGFVLVLLVAAVYFVITNKDIFGYIKNRKQAFKDDNETWLDLTGDKKADRVDTYFTRKFRWRAVRDVTHYDDAILKRVFQQHHLNAFILILFNAALLIGLGFMIDKPYFEIPAAGSVFLFFALLMALAGFIYYWAGKWGGVAFVVFIGIINYASQFDALNYNNQAYGVDYLAPKAQYNLSSLDTIASAENIKADKLATIAVLENWKKKASEGKPWYHKPKMLVVISSGGGATAASFTMKVLQTADSLTESKFMNHTALMSGASGGMMGIGYFRELYLRNQLGIGSDFYSKIHQKNVSKDLLNRLLSSVVTNDFFYPFQTRNIAGYDYVVDRGMMMEYAFNQNTNDVLKKPISAYTEFEKSAAIPMLFVGGTSVTDSRKLLISPLKISYMMRAGSEDGNKDNFEIDAIDFGRLFEKNNSYNLLFSSAMRINATYPLLLPNVSLPSKPQIDVMDAGVRDNYGMENALRFINVFHKWINKNTSGVVIVQIRGVTKQNQIGDFEYKSFLGRMTSPFGSVYGNLTVTQDYLHDYMASGTNQMLKNGLEIIRFEYEPEDKENRASMSFRLTEREFENVVQTAVDSINSVGYERLKEILN